MPGAAKKGGRRSAAYTLPSLPGVRLIEHEWIPLADGTRLAARIWLPADAEEHPVPALLEAIPYRKNDTTAPGDHARYGWFAAHGYAGVRVDIRGSGDSDGVLADEYLPQEQDDAIEVMAWLEKQPWCTGRVGMIGYSWGGFAALQVAARRPPQLGGIVTVASTDDRYADDVHYMGGCLLAYYLLSWATSMLMYQTLPPDPAVVGDAWRDTWRMRLRNARPMIEPWLTHQRRDDYWRLGSVCEDYSAITCPVYAVGGWADGYRNAVLRMLEHLECPAKGLIGPWSHHYAHDDVPPGPAIGFLQECVRFFDHCLKGIDNGIMDEPRLRTWMQDPVPPAPAYDERPGRWIAEPSWPSPNVETRTWPLDVPTGGAIVRSPQSTGLLAGDWDPFGNPADLPPDQRAEDGRSRVFDIGPLAEPVAILGNPRVHLDVHSDRPRALLAVRLCDVDETGASTLVTRGLANLAGCEGEMAVELKAIGQIVPAGHVLRVAVSTCYWPWAWPSPQEATVTIAAGRLDLPVRRAWDGEPEPAPFEPPEEGPRPRTDMLAHAPGDHEIATSVAASEHRLVHRYPSSRHVQPASGIEIAWEEPDMFTIRDGDPLSARVECERRAEIGRGAWRVRLEARSTMAADASHFHVTTELRAFEGDAAAHAGAWTFRIPRDGV